MNRVVALTALAVSVAAGCNGNASAPKLLDGAEMEAMALALCDAVAQVRAGEVRDARATFDDRAHEPLHSLAAVLQESDRATAARLLEAKQVVEAKFAQLDPTIGPDLDELAIRVGDGVRAAGGPLRKRCTT